MVGRNSVLGSLRPMMGAEGIGPDLDLAGWGESPWVGRVRRRCRGFVGEGCKLGCSAEVADSCFGKGCRKCSTVLVGAGIGCMVGGGLVIGMKDPAGRSWRLVRVGEKEGRFGSAGGFAGCSLVWGYESQRRSSKEDPRRIGSVVGRMNSVVHMTVRLSCTGCLDRTVKTQCGLEYCRCQNVQVWPAPVSHVVRRRILVVLKTDTMLEELGKSSYHHCSSLHAVVAAPGYHAVHWQTHAGLVPGTMLVGLGLNNHHCSSFVHPMNNHNCFDSKSHDDRQENS